MKTETNIFNLQNVGIASKTISNVFLISKKNNGVKTALVSFPEDRLFHIKKNCGSNL